MFYTVEQHEIYKQFMSINYLMTSYHPLLTKGQTQLAAFFYTPPGLMHGTALTTILPILFQYCLPSLFELSFLIGTPYKCVYSYIIFLLK
jgi:hypothetical protein